MAKKQDTKAAGSKPAGGGENKPGESQGRGGNKPKKKTGRKTTGQAGGNDMGR